MNKSLIFATVCVPLVLQTLFASVRADTHHVWEKVELTFNALQGYENPYTDVEVWVELKGPGFDKRCYGFWDGGHTFRVRVLATAPGRWTWESGANVADAGLRGCEGHSPPWRGRKPS